MTPGAILGVLAAAHLAAAMSPGPNTALVIEAATRSRRAGLLTAAGFWPAGAIWSAAGFAGLGSLFAAAPWLTTALGITAGFYLVHLGIKAVLRSLKPESGDVDAAAPAPWHRALRRGFLTNLGNPKSIAYYMSIFAATGAFDLPPQIRILAILMLPSIGFLWYGAIATVLSMPSLRRGFRNLRRWLDRVSGAAMIIFGLKLLGAR